MVQIEKLIVTHRGALKRKYGAKLAKIEAALARAIAADAQRGLTARVVALDDAKSLARVGGKPALIEGDERACKAAVDALARHYRPDYVVILGSVDVVPHVGLTNPVIEDREDEPRVPSDLPYACDAPFGRDVRKFFAPTRVVGRVPDLSGAPKASGLDPAYLVRQLNRAAKWKSRPRDDYAEHFGLSTMKWRDSTALSLANLYGAAAKLETSPPSGPRWSAGAMRRRIHFINCHGASRDWQFYGEHRGKQPSAHDSTLLDARAISEGSVVAAECCYGAELYDPTASEPRGLCSAYLDLGAYAFFGSTTIAYGPSSGNGQADLICQYFLERVLRGASTGRATLEARQRFLQAAATLDDTDLKTIAQFILLGDPSIHPVGRAPHALEESSAFAEAFRGPGAKRAARLGRRSWLLRGAEMIRAGVGAVGREERFRGGKRVRRALEGAAREEKLKRVVLASFRVRDPAGRAIALELASRDGFSVHVASGRRSARSRADGAIDRVKLVALVHGREIVSLRKLEAR